MASVTPLVEPPPLPPPPPPVLPVHAIPDGRGLPFLGPLRDRLDYFWFQGMDTFFKTRRDKYKSTVFRTNQPPFFPGVNTSVIAVEDCKSFSHLFDNDLVDKTDILVGPFMPSLKFSGGVRVCAYLDTTEPRHAQIKNFIMDTLKRSSTIWAPTVLSKLDIMWDTIESNFFESGSTSYQIPLEKFLFSFYTRCIIGADTASSPEIAESGHSMVSKWLSVQYLPVLKAGLLPQPLEEIFLHSFPLPFFLVRRDYNKLTEFIEKEGKEVMERGQTEFKLSRQDTLNNLLYMLGLNAFGGTRLFFLILISTLASEKSGPLHEKLRKEVREKCGSSLTPDSVKEMELVQSFVYETLRFHPPVTRQFGRARKDFLLSSHDSAYEIKKGELLCGYQPLVMRDPKVYDNPDTFDPYRFTGKKGNELLSYLYWSNGPHTESPSGSNKQCPGKNFVPLTACLFVAHVFLRYDSITCDSSGLITAIQKRTSE